MLTPGSLIFIRSVRNKVMAARQSKVKVISNTGIEGTHAP